MRRKIKISSNRLTRHDRIRRRVVGTAERPRLCLFRSLKHLEAQIIDDLESRTLVSLSTRDKEYAGRAARGGNVQSAEKLGAALAEKAKTKGIQAVVFDRGGYLYHGRVRAFAESARKHGLNF